MTVSERTSATTWPHHRLWRAICLPCTPLSASLLPSAHGGDQSMTKALLIVIRLKVDVSPDYRPQHSALETARCRSRGVQAAGQEHQRVPPAAAPGSPAAAAGAAAGGEAAEQRRPSRGGPQSSQPAGAPPFPWPRQAPLPVTLAGHVLPGGATLLIPSNCWQSLLFISSCQLAWPRMMRMEGGSGQVAVQGADTHVTDASPAELPTLDQMEAVRSKGEARDAGAGHPHD